MAKQQIPQHEHRDIDLKMDHLEEKIKDGNRMIVALITAEFQVVNMRLDKINGLEKRMEIVEERTAFIPTSKKYKWVVGLAIIGLISLSNIEQLKTWFLKMIPW